MRLDKCKFVANVTVEQVENCLQLWQQSFPQYQLTFEKPSYFNEIQDNPDPKNFKTGDNSNLTDASFNTLTQIKINYMISI